MPFRRTRITKLITVLLAFGAPLLLAEGILRISGVAPSGHFDFLLPAAGGGLYPPGVTIRNEWGVVPYSVETNALGFRGTGAAAGPSAGRARIVAIGDSVTDGFFVDNDGTYPQRLQQILDRDFEGAYEVINAARGGASIDKELAILEQVVLPLDPQVVILTFVTNDPAEILGKETRELLDRRVEVHRKNVPGYERAALWLITETAVGEASFRLFLHVAARGGDEPDPADASAATDADDRYVVEGAADYERNAAIFMRRNRRGDGLVLTDPLSPEVRRLMGRYFTVLDEFVATCRSAGIEPVLVYFPAYPQVYLPDAPRAIQDLLAEHCARLGIPFLDLTPAFRRGGREQVLHLAPLDYHLNPHGNQVMAEAIYEFLRGRRLVGRPAPERE